MWQSASEVPRRMQYGFELPEEHSIESQTSTNLLTWCIIPKLHMPSLLPPNWKAIYPFWVRHWQLLANTIRLWKWTSEGSVWTLLRLMFLNSIIRPLKLNSTTPLQERSLELDINMDSRIIPESKIEKERVQRVTQEIFGDHPQPRLEFAQYKLETKFKSD